MYTIIQVYKKNSTIKLNQYQQFQHKNLFESNNLNTSVLSS